MEIALVVLMLLIVAMTLALCGIFMSLNESREQLRRIADGIEEANSIAQTAIVMNETLERLDGKGSTK